MRTIGVISDTHGLLRPEAVEALRGSDLILHAGDVCGDDILAELGRIAPVRAVRGNMDGGPEGARLPTSDVADLSAADGSPEGAGRGPLAYVVHDLEDLDLDPAAAGIRLVVTGHTHRVHVDEKDGVVYLNPGSAGPRRGKLPVTVARVRIDSDALEVEIVELDVGG